MINTLNLILYYDLQYDKHVFYGSDFDNFTELTWLTLTVVSMATAPTHNSTPSQT